MLKWFLDDDGNKLLVKDCLEKGLLSHRYPMPYLVMCAEERPWTGMPSTTQLINGTRQEYLKLLTPYAINPDDQSFRIIGTTGHKKLEDLTPVGSFAELKIPVSEDEVSGIADLLEQQPNGEWWLTDYKTWGSYKILLALGYTPKKRPMIDEYGNAVVYKKKGKWGNAGDPKMETYYEIDPAAVDVPDVEMQVNRYRWVTEQYFGIDISKMKVFCMVRDGNTATAKGRGIINNTYYVPVKEVDDEDIKKYFLIKRHALLGCLDVYDRIVTNLVDEFWFDFDTLQDNCPAECNEQEAWKGRRCEGYCPVSEMCQMIGCSYLGQ